MEKGKKIIAIDMDGTLCESYNWSNWAEHSPNYWMKKMIKLKPIQKTINYVNKMYNEGNEIYIFTARDDIYTEVTIKWLKEHKVKYHWIQMKKPFYHIFVDDRTIRPEELK